MITPGIVGPQDAKALTDFLALTTENERLLQRQLARRDRFPARINSYDSATSRYSWTEQAFDANGNRYDRPGGRTGSATWMPAFAYGDGTVIGEFPAPVVLTRRVVTATLGPVYEFPLYCGCAAGSGGPVLTSCCANTLPGTLTLTVTAAGTCLDGKTVTLTYATGEWDGSLSFDCAGHTVAIAFRLVCAFSGIVPKMTLFYANSGQCGILPATGSGGLESRCAASPLGLDVFNFYTCHPFAATYTQESSGPTSLSFGNATGGAYVCGGDGNPVTLDITE